MRVDSAVTVITGASSGIGRAAALAFARVGARVVLAARDADRLTDVAREIEALGLPALVAPADVTRDDQVRSLMAAALQKHGRIDILICNAGIGLYGRVADLPNDALRRVFEVNFFGAVRCAQAALPSMLEQRSGLIQMVSSIIGRRAVPGYAGYCASKFALGGLAESLRVELAGTGVVAQTVYPGLTATEFAQHAIRRDPSRSPGPARAMPADRVARRMLEAARTGRRDTFISAGGRLLLLASALSPTLTDRLLARFMNPRAQDDADALSD